ncbi:hypothetical protein A2160_01455 [Candidatus Beckwithbacteria bacterium RBG_13_42_9]|uniref:DUF4382 domain-containing protein n=1 Tax=Candidatus Beckwithbacteria bacterium RBG_13_42_9 TaxID=1797457 RepID=A0A1F5E949_9BACT|nr:MAG: hypothetical protein A2160_01455 [Candidatus Beckwithbacteria bacterium RBG_13_42_9]
MKKILLSLMTVVLVGAATVGATRAYFSDTETSAGNTFEAGRLDLRIDNNSTYNGLPNPSATFSIRDLTNELFFNFTDVKPGDYGQDTVSLHVDDNPSWLCANITLTEAAENLSYEPETSDGDNTNTGSWEGELDDQLNFFFWADTDSDGSYDVGETQLMNGPASSLPQGDDNGGVTYPIVDATYNAFGPVGSPFPEGDPGRYIGKVWCHGALTLDPAAAPGYICDGSQVNNVAQSDSVRGDVSFYAVQTRHNDQFNCSSWTPEVED